MDDDEDLRRLLEEYGIELPDTGSGDGDLPRLDDLDEVGE